MSNVAYIKIDLPVETSKQVAEVQKHSIDFLYLEESPIDENRELTKVLEVLSDGDTLIIYSLSAIWKNKKSMDVFKILTEKKIRLISLQENVDTQKKQYELLYNHIHLFKGVEESIRSVKIRDAIENRRNLGKSIGRPKIEASKQEEILSLFKQKMSLRDISRLSGISLGTVHKYVTEANQTSVKS